MAGSIALSTWFACRYLGEVKREYADTLRRADAIFIEDESDGVSRVVYDVSRKPPATIEGE